jgi:hypothetical protein
MSLRQQPGAAATVMAQDSHRKLPCSIARSSHVRSFLRG